MKKLALLTVVVLAGMALRAQNPKIINDPNAQQRNVGEFHGVAVGGGIELFLSQGTEDAVAVSANNPEVRDRIVTEVRDGVLHIHPSDQWWHWNWNGHLKLKAYVSCKTLDQLREGGGATIHVGETLKSERLDVQVSGGGRIEGKFEVGEMTVGISGGGDTYISGTSGQLQVHVSGGGAFHGYDLNADTCQAHVSGGGDIFLTVNKALDASVSGGGEIRYKGNGTIRDLHTRGGGNISRG